MKILPLALVAAFSLSACATTKPIPTTRKLTPEVMSKIEKTDVIIAESDGIRAGWTSAAAAPQGYTDYTYLAPPGTSPAAAGIGGALGTAIGAAIVDAAPSARAKRSVAAINTSVSKEELDAALVRKIKSASAASAQVQFGDVSTRKFERKTPTPMDALIVDTNYMLAEDASAIRVWAKVTYDSDTLTYQTPYDFDGKPPKSESKGPLYRNVFSYHSDRFEAPIISDAVKAELRQAIEYQYSQDVSDIEPEDDREKVLKKLDKAKAKALEDAEDDKLSKTEKATLLIGRWQGEGTSLSLQVIDAAQDFIASMVVMDLNNTDIPQYETKEPKEKPGFFSVAEVVPGPIGQEDYTVLESKTDGRKVVRLDSGLYSGAYHSYPEDGFATYGNTYKLVRE